MPCYVLGCADPPIRRVIHRRFGPVDCCATHDPTRHAYGSLANASSENDSFLSKPSNVPDVRIAADHGDPIAQMQIGDLYFDGRGVPQNHREAARWYQKAAEQGLAEAQIVLGSMYRNGEGIQQDDVRAVHWFRKAADRGWAIAQYELGYMYLNGRGTERDRARAFYLWHKAADQGEARAQRNLAVVYFNGDGVNQDCVAAHMWLNLAVTRSSGDYQRQCIGDRDEVAKYLTPSQLTEAERRAAEWLAAFEKSTTTATSSDTHAIN
jgi:hypothetical protein